jgi:hypothetical protein
MSGDLSLPSSDVVIQSSRMKMNELMETTISVEDNHDDDNDDEIMSESHVLSCLQCHHPLDNRLYYIHYHPHLELAMCAICFDELEMIKIDDNGSYENDNDVCFCCRETMDILNICANCPRSYCHECLSDNLTPEMLRACTADDNWECLVCNKKQIMPRTMAAQALASKSLYSMGYFNEVEYVDENKITIDIMKLQVLNAELIASEQQLEASSLSKKRLEISKELNCAVDDVEAREELQLLEQRWRHHFDVIQHQEGRLMDALLSEGIDVSKLPEYDISSLQTMVPSEETSRELGNEFGKKGKMKLGEDEEFASDDDFEQCLEITPTTTLPTAEALNEMTKQCGIDPLVKELLERAAPLGPNVYPAFFEKIAPKEALHACIEAHGRKREELISRYCIPEYVHLQLRYARGHHMKRPYTVQGSKIHPLLLTTMRAM